MNGNQISEPWYKSLANEYGESFAVEAGYFPETMPWTNSYSEQFDLISKTSFQIIQFSGAFFPFHGGHRDCIQSAIDFLKSPVLLFLHIDHKEYRHSKGTFDEARFQDSFQLTETFSSLFPVETRLIFEDKMPNSCSRNFTRLYQEIMTLNLHSAIWFLAGGDRASYSLSFKDQGRCIISGRSAHASFFKYAKNQSERIVFLPGSNAISSSQIRKQNGQ